MKVNGTELKIVEFLSVAEFVKNFDAFRTPVERPSKVLTTSATDKFDVDRQLRNGLNGVEAFADHAVDRVPY